MWIAWRSCACSHSPLGSGFRDHDGEFAGMLVWTHVAVTVDVNDLEARMLEQ